MTKNRLTCIIIGIVVFIFYAGAAFSEELPIVTSIEIKGLKRIEESALKNKITQRAGTVLSNEKTTEDIKNIFKTGYFDDIKIEMEPFEGGIKLIYIVKEKPTVVKIEFQGNSDIDDSKLREQIGISTGSIADTILIQDNADKLRSFYEKEGYYLARVVPVLMKKGEDEILLTYQIEEGEKVKIRNINLEGNKNISTNRIKKVMETKTWGLFSFITSSGYFKKAEMSSDIERIKELYFNNGYIKAVVADPKINLTDDKKGMIIAIQISEGEQYKISSIELRDNKVFTEAELRKNMSVKPNSIFDRGAVRKDIESLTNMYSEKGYALASISLDILPEEALKQVRVILRVAEGDVYKVGRIEISGNVKTRDKVIRREVRIDEGSVFNSSLIKRSYERINNLNFFESVEMRPKPRYDEKLIDMNINVKEKATGFFSVGGGYSSVDKFIGMFDVTQGNLFGKGQYLKLKGELGGRSSFYELSFRDPWFMDKPLSFATGIYRTTRKYIEYEKKSTGFDVSLGKSFGEYWSGNVTYNFENATIYNIVDTASEKIKEQKGQRTTSSLTPTIARDTRDSFLDPSTGSRNLFSLTFAGLGGTNAFLKGNLDSAWFFPIKSTTISLRGRAGYAVGMLNKQLPLYERYYVGGIYTVRGLGFGNAGPKDKNGEAIGGTKQLIFNTEYIFPIVSELKLKGLVFLDAGNSYDSNEAIGRLRHTTGTGIRWISPMGPIRIEWGYNLKRKPGENSSKWEFTFGSFF